MKKAILLLLTLALCLNNTYAQNNSNKSLLWEISGKGLTSPSYLFGTYHFASKKLVDSLSDTKKYFNNCKTVVGELIMDPTETAKLASFVMLADSTSLEKLFTPDEYKLISDYVTQLTKMDMRMISRLKPATVQLMLLSFTAPKTFSDTNPAIDLYFQQEGKRLNNKIIGLETMEEQGNLIFGAPMAEQKKNLLESISKKDEAKIQGEKLYALYLNQDLDAINKMLTDDFAKNSTPELSDKMLKDRNLKWIAKIPSIVSEQPSFIAVGAAHLVGQYGLINQLRLKGYTLKPIKI